MARWRRSFIREVMEQLVHLGLSSCVVCGSGELQLQSRPRVLQVGGSGTRRLLQPPDPEESIDYLIAVRCSMCGHELLFHSSKYRKDAEQVLIRGVSEEEERRAEEGT